MKCTRSLAMWLFKTEWIPLGALAPHVLAIALGCKDYGKVEPDVPCEEPEEDAKSREDTRIYEQYDRPHGET